ncbi:MAG TPA: TetR/AcrR family transcriptional regulator [Burkholderiaceae bacterium]|nr:TetR/AcrR family transcriptional regulator [Burkholderiaceae bacterium]
MNAIVRNPVRKLGRPAGVSETRERLIDAASTLFASNGFAGTSLREISEGLGVSGPALLHHFGSKSRLYAEVLDRIVASMKPYLPPEHQVADREGAVAMVGAYLDWTLRYPQYSQLIMRELMENRERVDKAKNLSMKPVMDAMISYLERGQQQGKLPDFDAQVFAFFYTGAVAHFVSAAPTVRRILDSKSDDEILRRFRRTLLDSIGAMLDGFSRQGSESPGAKR